MAAGAAAAVVALLWRHDIATPPTQLYTLAILGGTQYMARHYNTIRHPDT